ncbi:DUF397 domain-containing protein [Amycolatopsis minnesotensis]|uniref:DUF397 domain-containing protein n=2 Tax=Amycolatopsis minnesotensis TaxID=337894 RepID=A0ABP5CPQ5_9PSEU
MPTPDLTGLTWRKSSYSDTSGQADCVEMAICATTPAVRDSKAPEAGHLTPTPAGWRAFLADLRR